MFSVNREKDTFAVHKLISSYRLAAYTHVSDGRIPGVSDGRIPGINDGRIPGVSDGRIPGINDGRIPGVRRLNPVCLGNE